ncbi:hypothetical protein X801_10549 [Opisthorchis viverrini]|uniref:Regulator of microtubule dynamics protein 1 n=1 Tax=Opisthorchis viverrini TaxID=6198 RepID=A0A1S8WGW0_OPIVI|nr:hypothetical protein X801_10549 [Opisthorchis viverrini]
MRREDSDAARGSKAHTKANEKPRVADADNYDPYADDFEFVSTSDLISMEELYEKADALFELENYTDCYNLLVDIEECHQVADVYWRLARCLYYKSGLPCVNVCSIQKSQITVKRRDHQNLSSNWYLPIYTATRKLELNWIPKIQTVVLESPQWYGIGVDELAGLDGVHERLKHSPVSHYYWTVSPYSSLSIQFSKCNLQKAIELDPNNFLAHSELGIWYFIVSDVSEVIRKFETVFYTSPPIATYEENVSFSQSDIIPKVCPRHLIRNMLYLAKCYKALGQYDESLAFCKLVIEYQGSGYDVEEVRLLDMCYISPYRQSKKFVICCRICELHMEIGKDRIRNDSNLVPSAVNHVSLAE